MIDEYWIDISFRDDFHVWNENQAEVKKVPCYLKN